MRVPHARAGVDGPSMSRLSLGSWHTWDRMAFDAAVELVRAATDAGIDTFDVGHYNFGPHAEGSQTDVLFGRIVAAAGLGRGDYVLCQKLWLWDYPGRALSDQLDQCLERVGTDHADLVILGDFVGELDRERVVADVAGLLADGRAAHWGVNNWSADDLRAVHAIATRTGVPAPTMAQLKYSVCRRSIPEGEPYRRIFTELGVGLQASDVFEGGILAGRAVPSRRIGADTGGIREAISAAAPHLATIAAELDATPAQLAIAYCLTHPSLSSVLFGVSRMAQLTGNLGALDLLLRHGDTLRDRLTGLWLDRGVVAPTASWGTS